MATNLQELIPAIFTGPNGERLTPEQIAQRQQIAQSLIGRATDTSPDAGGWASVLTKGILGYKSGADTRAADAAIKANAAESQASISSMLGGLGLGGGAGFPSPVASGASPTSAVATGTPVSVPSAPEIRQGLIDRGLQPHIADAFILNFQDESGLNPAINEQNPIVPGSRGGYGLYQLTGPRRREYEAFAAQRGMPVDSADAQLDFLMNELQGSEARAAESILSAPDTATAAQAIVNNFLRPAPEHRQARAERYGRVATTPQEAIAQVAPQVSTDMGSFDSRWDAGAATPEGQPSPQYDPGQVVTGPDGQTYQNVEQIDGSYALTPYNPNAQAPAVDQRLLDINDQMMGGALSPSGSSPVAQALSGNFPEAPSADRAPVTSQPFQIPSSQSSGGINPAIVAALSNPYASQQERQIAGMLLGQQMKQAQSAQEQQRLLAQRQATAQTLGINPALAGDEEAWKASIDQATRNRNTVTVGNTVYDANTGQPVIQGQGDPTSDIQNYEYARNNGFQGSFADFQQQVKRAGATTVDARQMGNIPPGYQVQYNEQGQPISMAPIPGSPDFIKAQREREAFEQGRVSQDRTSQVVTQDIDRAMELIEQSPFTTTGAIGPALSKIGGTASNDVNQLITTIKANAGFDRLQAMRDASPTGGALGAVSERELTYLQSTIGSLDQSQTKEQLIRNLQRVRKAYSDIIDGPQGQSGALEGDWRTLPNGVKIRAKQ